MSYYRNELCYNSTTTYVKQHTRHISPQPYDTSQIFSITYLSTTMSHMSNQTLPTDGLMLTAHSQFISPQSQSIRSPACLHPERSTRQALHRQMVSHRADHPSSRTGCDPHEPGSDSQATDSSCISMALSARRIILANSNAGRRGIRPLLPAWITRLRPYFAKALSSFSLFQRSRAALAISLLTVVLPSGANDTLLILKQATPHGMPIIVTK